MSRWLKADGSPVQAGEPLLELETDKATNVVPAPGSGVLKIGVAEGETVAIGATVGTIDPAGHARRGGPAPGSRPRQPAANGRTARGRAGSRPRQPAPGDADRPLSPSVRRLVAEQDVDVAQVAGTGPGGRVTKGDVLTFLDSPTASAGDRDRRPPRPRRPGPGLPPVATPAPAAPAVAGVRRPPRDPAADERAAPADRPATGRGPADRGDPDDLQRSRHVAGHGAARPVQGDVPEGSTARRWASCRSSSRRRSRPSRRSPPSTPGSTATRSSTRTSTTSAWRSAPRRG